MSLLDAWVVLERQEFRLDVRLHLRAGEVVAVLGPNGAGKTTLLRALAGLLPLTSGYVRLDGRELDGDTSFVPPQRRPISVVFQDYLLFPHLNAMENVAFGPRSRGVRRSIAHREAHAWLARMGLDAYAHRKPRALSGGQAQRVALARALAIHPRLLLLDEPLAALDVATRTRTRASLAEHLGSFPGATVLVTHDTADALSIADRLIIIEDGAVTQDGSAADLAAMPATPYVTALLAAHES